MELAIFTLCKKLFMKGKLFSLLFLLFAFINTNLNATHLVGGSLTYEHLGGSTYRILLKMYRDCTPATAPHAAFASTARIDIYNSAGTPMPFSPLVVPLVQVTNVPLNLDTCVADPGICIEEGLYAAIVNNLPPTPGGYHMYYETCCRNSSVTNVNNPLNAGEGFYCKISDNTILLSNSSPQWLNFPPVFVCVGQPINFNHGATDPDGDSLAYSFYRPFSDVNYLGDNDLTFTGGIPNFVLVNYNGGYGFNNPLGGSNLTLINGVVDGIPGAIGQYVVGVRCDEYRDGILIGSIYRDFQFNVVVCPPPALAGIGPINGCNGATIQMVNTSTPSANGFQWDFGDGTPTSTLTNPSHTFPGLGPYTVQLIAQLGTPCADTAYQTFSVSFANANYSYNDSACVGTPISFTNTSTAAINNSVNSWSWNFGDLGTSTLPNPTHTYTNGGLYNVTLIVNSTQGCRDTIVQQMFIQGNPIANAGPDTTACLNNPLITLNGIITNASGGLWLNGASNIYTPNASTLNAVYTPDPTEFAQGFVQLILSTTGNGLCPAATDTLIINFIDGPIANAGPDIQVCKDTSSFPVSGTIQFAGGGQWSTSGSGSFLPSVNALNATYIPSVSDANSGQITIYLTTTNVGNCFPDIDSLIVGFYDPPTAQILNSDTACSGDPIVMTVNTTNNSGYWSTNGTGVFNPDSLIVSFYTPSAADIANGTVTFYFVSTNNGGCLAARDTIDVTIIPSPNPAFTFTEPCLGGTSVFTDQSTAVGGVVGWEWLFGDGQTSPLQNPNHVYGTSGIIPVSLIAISTNGCRDTLTQNVNVHYLPNAAFFSPNPCLNGGTDFTDQSTVTNSTIASWSWVFGDGGTSTNQNPNHLYPSAGNYPVTLIVTSAFGCADTITQNTTVLPGPNANFSMSDNSVNQFETVFFTDLSTPIPIVSWQWDFGDNSTIDLTQNPSHAYNGSGNFTVVLVVEDNNGCYDTAKREVIVFLPPNVPTAFSPNGDGVNDILYVYGGPFKELEFNIYNNWGQLIFTSNDQSIGWDGTYKDVPQPMSVYVFTVKAITMDDVEHVITGDVTLLR